ncbi:MAG: rRNA maturation RNase YbeY [Pseudomonadota bacterium]
MTTATEPVARITLDIACDATAVDCPDTESWQRAADVALSLADIEVSLDGEQVVAIAIVPPAQSAALNTEWRDKPGPTNVLAFPVPRDQVAPIAELSGEGAHLGDLVICADVVADEAKAQGKALAHHYLHMVVHGCLHLVGYDHIEADEAERMEALERQALQALGVPDPYAV